MEEAVLVFFSEEVHANKPAVAIKRNRYRMIKDNANYYNMSTLLFMDNVKVLFSLRKLGGGIKKAFITML